MLPLSILLALITVGVKRGQLMYREDSFYPLWGWGVGSVALFFVVLFSAARTEWGAQNIAPVFPWIHIFLYLILIASLVIKPVNRGMMVIALGLFLNLIPIVLNGKMPVQENALIRIGQPEMIPLLSRGYSLTHQLGGKGSGLGDWIPLGPPWPFPEVISPGDLLMAIGLYSAIVSYGLKRRKTHA